MRPEADCRWRSALGAAVLMVWLEGCGVRAPNYNFDRIANGSGLDPAMVTRVASGTPVQVEVEQDVNGFQVGTIENVRLRVRESVWAGDLLVIEEGAEVTGTATVKLPEIGAPGEVALAVKTVASVTREQIPLLGGYSRSGLWVSCEICFWEIFRRGEYARIRKGEHFEAYVGSGVELRSAKLQAFMDNRFAATEKAISRCDHVGTVRVYILASDANPTLDRLQDDARYRERLPEPAEQIYLNGTAVGWVRPGSVLTLAPVPGSYDIGTRDNTVSVEVDRCTPHFVRVSRVASRGKLRFDAELIGTVRGEDETRGLQEVLNRE